MDKPRRKKLIYCISIIVIAVLIGFKPVSAAIADYMERAALVRDLALLTGLTEDEIWHLEDLRGDLDFVRDNIFAYKDIVLIAKAAELDQATEDDLISDYDPIDLLTVCQYLSENETSLELASHMLAEHESGESLENLLDAVRLEKDFKLYIPATEEEVSNWLRKGYLPGDILMADEIARDADVTIGEVISKKTAAIEWEIVADSYGSPAVKNSEEIKQAKLDYKENSQIISYEEDTYKNAADKISKKEKEDAIEREDQITASLSLSDEQINSYLEQGFNINEINNAVRLSKESGVKIQSILDEKKAGSDWESLVEKYHDKEAM